MWLLLVDDCRPLMRSTFSEAVVRATGWLAPESRLCGDHFSLNHFRFGSSTVIGLVWGNDRSWSLANAHFGEVPAG